MQKIHLLIANPSLLSALSEQLSLFNLPFGSSTSGLGEALLYDENAVIVFDESAADRKNLKALHDGDDAQKKRVVLLGQFQGLAPGVVVAEALNKPIRLGYLISRLQFYLEIAPRLRIKPLAFGPYRLEPQNRQVIVENSGQVIRLTEKETALLEYLGRQEKCVEREELLAAIWGYDARIDTHTLETHIYQLRRKLDPETNGINVLVNEKGGYRLKRD